MPAQTNLYSTRVDDTDATYAGLLAHGATAMSEPHDWLGTLRVAWVVDPDGHPVELVQRTV
ncbi:MAG TPA: VOC family protein [Nocardioides sp.]|uniref:VOC family protein n=1 Tax=Nocardioides sp. TaxID=35761 RepID=UPI002E351A5A|nr:VOC family protein [Nocardioides sp.]HEX5090717.1 VOC family protein [Nocardioides sp.]